MAFHQGIMNKQLGKDLIENAHDFATVGHALPTVDGITRANGSAIYAPDLSLPNMLVIGSVMGVQKTAAFSIIIVVLSAIPGMTYGWIAS